MYEYTVNQPFTLMGVGAPRSFQVGEKITDPSLFEALERPTYARSVSRHYITTDVQEEARKAEEAAQKPADGDKAADGASAAPSDAKAATSRRSASAAPSADAAQ